MAAATLKIEPSQAPARQSPPPLFFAVHDVCNLRCWYCTEQGENRDRGRWLEFDRLLEILRVAYARGIRTFRATGGEPTLRHDLDRILLATQALGDDVRIAITTNGHRLDRHIDALRQLNKPRVFLSIDRPQGDQADAHGALAIPKMLTPALERTIDELTGFASVRLNFVLTRGTLPHVWSIIDAAIERRIDVKIFELLHRDYFWAGQRPPDEVFLDQYVSIRTLLPELRARFGQTEPFRGTGGRGIPMHTFRHGASRIIYFDSQEGSHYGDICARQCPRFPCQEGLYALLLDVSGTLHPAGCENTKLYVPLAEADAAKTDLAFSRLQSVLDLAELLKVEPRALRPRLAKA
jgi:molybdenum cofactor biosynthesis enzyme MoaA